MVAVVVAVTLLTRLAYLPTVVMGFDGPEYINALNFDSTYNVPPPGNIGYVAIAKVFSWIGLGPVAAFGLTGTLLSCIAGAYICLLAALMFSRTIALFVSLAVMLSPMAWYHGVIMQSYVVWLAALPTIAYYGLRHIRRNTWASLISLGLATGISTILRPDLVIFGGPMMGSALLIAWFDRRRSGGPGRSGPSLIAAVAVGGAICAVCCCIWFFSTASLLGGVDRYLEAVRSKNEWHDRFGVANKGLVEGLARNGVKYVIFMLWAANFALVPAAVGAAVYLRRFRARWRAAVMAAAWLAPSLYFSWIIFMGNAGLVLPALPVVYLAAAAGSVAMLGTRRTVWVMAGLGAINAATFLLAPLRFPRDQREALVNHMFLGYSGPGLRMAYTWQLEDFGIDRSLSNTLRQFRSPDPLPRTPAGAAPSPGAD